MTKLRNTLLLLLLLAWIAPAALASNLKTGIEVLRDQHFELLRGKRVGLITNPTGVDRQMQSTVDILFNAPDVHLVALFGPEHGVRGDAHAGDAVGSQTDPVTHLPVYSLYGKTRKPTSEMLRGIDVLVYDIQDIGCRSFTYISTMGLAMEAAAEQGIEFVVLDRPNPLGGEKIEGPIVAEGSISFVSQYPIPYLYGLTCGELARLLNEEGMTAHHVSLHVVPMEGWRRSMTYEQTGLQWIPSSPHIPQALSACFYPVSGILGEFNNLSIGVGYTIPFQLFAAEWIDAEQLSSRLNELHLKGVHFRPIHFKPFYAVGAGTTLHGVQVHLMDYRAARLTDIQFYVIQEVAALWPEHAIFANADPSRFKMFDNVSGSPEVRRLLGARNRFDDLKAYWQKDENTFRSLAKKYYLYND